MQKFLLIAWFVVIFCLNQTSQAQYHDDQYSILDIDLGGGNQIILKTHKTTLKEDINRIENLNAKITDINATLNNLSNPLDPFLAYKITYIIAENGKPNLKIKQTQDGQLFDTQGDNQGKPIKVNADTIVIQYPESAVIFTIKNLEELKKIEKRPLDGYLSALKRDFNGLPKKYHRNHLNISYTAQNNNLERSSIDLIRRDYLEITPGAGLSIVRDRVVPLISVNIDFVLRDKFLFGIREESNFIFEQNDEGKYRVFHNSFIGGRLGFKLGPQNIFSTQGWFTLGFDKQFARNGDFYDENTYRLSIGVPVGKIGLRLTPQYYISSGDDFLGFKMGFNF